MIKYTLTGLMVMMSIYALGQTSHQVTVKINQETSECPIVAGIEDAASINIYPNPGKNVITVSATFLTGHVDMYDLQGRHVFQDELKNGRLELEVSALSRGIYIIYLEHNSGIEKAKIIVE